MNIPIAAIAVFFSFGIAANLQAGLSNDALLISIGINLIILSMAFLAKPSACGTVTSENKGFQAQKDSLKDHVEKG